MRLQSVGESGQQVVETELSTDLNKLLITDRSIQPKIVGHIAAEQECVLQHDPQLTPQICHRDAADVTSIQKDAPLLGVIEAAEQTNDGALAGTRGAHQRHMLSRSDAEGKIAEDGLIRPVREAHVVEDHFAATASNVRINPLGLGDFEGLLHQLTDSFHSSQSALNLREALGQLTQRIKQTL